MPNDDLLSLIQRTSTAAKIPSSESAPQGITTPINENVHPYIQSSFNILNNGMLKEGQLFPSESLADDVYFNSSLPSNVINGALNFVGGVGGKLISLGGTAAGAALDVASAPVNMIMGNGLIPTLKDTWMFDNPVIRLGQSIDKGSENLFPIITGPTYDSYSLLQQMSTPAFWTKDFEEGVESVAEQFVLAAATAGTSAGAAVGKFGQFLMSTAVQTLDESIIEARDTYKQVKAAYQERKDNGELTITDNEIEQLSGEAASRTFKANAIVLLGPNAISSSLFGFSPNLFGKSADRLRRSIQLSEEGAEATVKKGVSAAFSNTGKFINNYVRPAVVGFGSEGLWEENSQNAIQSQELKYAQGKLTSIGMSEYASAAWEGIVGTGKFFMGQTLTPEQKEAAKAAVLGGLIGAPMQLYQASKERANKKTLESAFKSDWDNFKTQILAGNNVFNYEGNLYKVHETEYQETNPDGTTETKIKTSIVGPDNFVSVDMKKAEQMLYNSLFDKELWKDQMVALASHDQLAGTYNSHMALAHSLFKYLDQVDKGRIVDSKIAGNLFKEHMKRLIDTVPENEKGFYKERQNYMDSYVDKYVNMFDKINDRFYKKRSGINQDYRDKAKKALFVNEIAINALESYIALEDLNNPFLESLEAAKTDREAFRDKVLTNPDIFLKEYNKEMGIRTKNELDQEISDKAVLANKDATEAQIEEAKDRLQANQFEREMNKEVYGDAQSNLAFVLRPEKDRGKRGTLDQTNFEHGRAFLADTNIQQAIDSVYSDSATGEDVAAVIMETKKQGGFLTSTIKKELEKLADYLTDKFKEIHTRIQAYEEIQFNLEQAEMEINKLSVGKILSAIYDNDDLGDELIGQSFNDIYEYILILNPAIDGVAELQEAILEVTPQDIAEYDIRAKQYTNYKSQLQSLNAQYRKDKEMANQLAEQINDVLELINNQTNRKIDAWRTAIAEGREKEFFELEFINSQYAKLEALKQSATDLNEPDSLSKEWSDVEGAFAVLNSLLKVKSYLKLNKPNYDLAKVNDYIETAKELITLANKNTANREGIQQAIYEAQGKLEALGIGVEIDGATSIIFNSSSDEVKSIFGDLHKLMTSALDINNILSGLEVLKEAIHRIGKMPEMLALVSKFNRNARSVILSLPYIKKEYLESYFDNPQVYFYRALLMPIVENLPFEEQQQLLIDNLGNNVFGTYNDSFDFNLFVKKVSEIKESKVKDSILAAIQAHKGYYATFMMQQSLESVTMFSQILSNEQKLIDSIRKQVKKFVPSQQQKLVIRQLLKFLGSKKSMAYVRGFAGTGKTKLVTKWFLTLSGIDSKHVFGFSHNDTTSKNLNDAIGTANNSKTDFFALTPTSASDIKMFIIDEIGFFTEKEIIAFIKHFETIKSPNAKLLILGDPAQITKEVSSGLNSLVEDAYEKVSKLFFTTPLTIVYRTDVKAITAVSDLYRNSREFITNKLVSISSKSFSTVMDSKGTQHLPKGVVAGGVKEFQDVFETNKKNGRSKLIIVNNTAEKGHYTQYENFADVMTYEEAQGRTYDEVYVLLNSKGLDINGKSFTPVNNNWIKFNRAMYTSVSRASQMVFVLNETFTTVEDPTIVENVQLANKGLDEAFDRYEDRLNKEIELFNKFAPEGQKIDSSSSQVEVEEDLTIEEPVVEKPVDIDEEVGEELDEIFKEEPDQEIEEDIEVEENEGTGVVLPDEPEDTPPIPITPIPLIDDADHELVRPENELNTDELTDGTKSVNVAIDAPVIYVLDDKGQIGIYAQKTEQDKLVNLFIKVGMVDSVMEKKLYDELMLQAKTNVTTNKKITGRMLNGQLVGAKLLFDSENRLLDSNVGQYGILKMGRVKHVSALQYEYSPVTQNRGKTMFADLLAEFTNKFFKGDSKSSVKISVKIFKKSDLLPEGAWSDLLGRVKPGIPYLVFSNIKTEGNKRQTKIQTIRLSPRRFNRSDVDSSFKELAAFYSSMNKFEEKLRNSPNLISLFGKFTLGHPVFNKMLQEFKENLAIDESSTPTIIYKGNILTYEDFVSSLNKISDKHALAPLKKLYEQNKGSNEGLFKEYFNLVQEVAQESLHLFYGIDKVQKLYTKAEVEANTAEWEVKGFIVEEVKNKNKEEIEEDDDSQNKKYRLIVEQKAGINSYQTEYKLVGGKGLAQIQLNKLSRANQFVSNKEIRVIHKVAIKGKRNLESFSAGRSLLTAKQDLKAQKAITYDMLEQFFGSLIQVLYGTSDYYRKFNIGLESSLRGWADAGKRKLSNGLPNPKGPRGILNDLKDYYNAISEEQKKKFLQDWEMNNIDELLASVKAEFIAAQNDAISENRITTSTLSEIVGDSAFNEKGEHFSKAIINGEEKETYLRLPLSINKESKDNVNELGSNLSDDANTEKLGNMLETKFKQLYPTSVVVSFGTSKTSEQIIPLTMPDIESTGQTIESEDIQLADDGLADEEAINVIIPEQSTEVDIQEDSDLLLDQLANELVNEEIVGPKQDAVPESIKDVLEDKDQGCKSKK